MNGLILFLSLCGIVPAEVNSYEVLRAGNRVMETATYGAEQDGIYAAALAPPADDSDKWFISVVTRQGCRPCEQLKTMFQKDQYLRAWVYDDPNTNARAWAHYNVFRMEDPSQQYRWAKIRAQGYTTFPRSFPCIIIQPPKNSQYGENKTIVALLYYNGENGKELGERMRRSVDKYVANLRVQPNPYQPYNLQPNPYQPLYREGGEIRAEQPDVGGIEQHTPPFDVGPRYDDTRRPLIDLQIPPVSAEYSKKDYQRHIDGVQDDKFLRECVKEQYSMDEAEEIWDELQEEETELPFDLHGKYVPLYALLAGIAAAVFYFKRQEVAKAVASQKPVTAGDLQALLRSQAQPAPLNPPQTHTQV